MLYCLSLSTAFCNAEAECDKSTQKPGGEAKLMLHLTAVTLWFDCGFWILEITTACPHLAASCRLSQFLHLS